MIDVAVIDWGTPRLAARCVGSLESDAFSSIELIDARARGLSYAHAVNRSLSRGSAPIVLAMNADTRLLHPAELDTIIGIFGDDPRIAVIGPRQIDDRGLITHAGIIGDNAHRAHRYWLAPLGDVADRCSERALDVPTVSGAVYFCRRDVWERFGGFLAACPHFYEETGLDFQVRAAGYRVVYTGASTWEHLWNRSPTTAAWRAERATESRSIFIEQMAARGILAA